MKQARGAFVAVDGPKNVGKTSVLRTVRGILERWGVSAVFTKEPTPRFVLDNEQRYSGRQLAELLAADRAHHLSEVVTPGLRRCDAVITDRYIASSLVFQVLDGVPFADVWALNKSFSMPDLNIIMDADVSSLRRRRRLRETRTRLEENAPEAERLLYRQAGTFLTERGVNVVHVDNSDTETEESAADRIASSIVAAVGRSRD